MTKRRFFPTSTVHRSSRRAALPLAAVLLVMLALSACSDDDSDFGGVTDLVLVQPVPTSAAAQSQLSVTVVARTLGGAPIADALLDASVERGGGSVAPASVRTDANGQATLSWSVGAAPVRNELAISAGRGAAALTVTTQATLATPLTPAPFGDVNAFLTAQGISGSTEDLEVTPDESAIAMGVPTGLIALDPSGDASLVPLSGDPIVGPLGIAYDRDGTLWVADSGGKALRRVSPDGVVTTALTDDGTRPLAGPNFIAIGPDDRVYLSDPCLGELIRFDPQQGRVDAILPFDLPTEGGPNGLAFDADGRLYLTTENTGLLCSHSFVDIIAPIAGLFAVDVSDAGFGARETIVANFALFGDGLTFDVEGNLYVIFDTQANFALDESALWVLPAGGRTPAKFLSVRDRVLANPDFGRGDFGDGTLYIALLAVPPFTSAEARGIERIDVGIAGLPLLP